MSKQLALALALHGLVSCGDQSAFTKKPEPLAQSPVYKESQAPAPLNLAQDVPMPPARARTQVWNWSSPQVQQIPLRPFYAGRPLLIANDALRARDSPELNILVHGNNLALPTLWGKFTWNHPNTKSYQAFEATGGRNLTFLWSGANPARDRHEAGIILGQNMFDLAVSGKIVNVWAHSHGGNVTLEAINEFHRLATLYQQSTGLEAPMLGRVVTIATPFRPEHALAGERWNGPLQWVRSYANVAAASDWVVPFGGTFKQVVHREVSPFDYRADQRWMLPGSHNTIIFSQKHLGRMLSVLGPSPFMAAQLQKKP